MNQRIEKRLSIGVDWYSVMDFTGFPFDKFRPVKDIEYTFSLMICIKNRNMINGSSILYLIDILSVTYNINSWIIILIRKKQGADRISGTIFQQSEGFIAVFARNIQSKSFNQLLIKSIEAEFLFRCLQIVIAQVFLLRPMSLS